MNRAVTRLRLLCCLGLLVGSVGPAGAGTHESPTVYYDRLRAEFARTAPATAINAQVAAARRAASIGDLTSCPAVPPPGAQLTRDGFYFLTQILPPGIADDSAACGKALACFLGTMVAHQANPLVNPPSLYSEATLVIDRKCVVTQTLVVPDRFVLAGVGPEGRGVLAFDLPDNAAAIRFGASGGVPQRFTTIRDLNIVNVPRCCGQVGIDVSNSSFVTIERIRLHDFGFGLLGANSFTIRVDKSDIHNNGFNVVIADGSTSWRLRDSVLNQGALIGLVISPTAIGHVIAGGRIEHNPFAGVSVQGPQNFLQGNWLEGNGVGFGDHGIRILPGADQTRIYGNLFSSEDVADAGTNTQICLNTDDNGAGDVNTCGL